MEEIIIYSYFIIGGIFLGYSWLTVIQRCLANAYRFGIAGMFLGMGLFFMSAAGELLTSGNEDLKIISLAFALFTFGVATYIIVYIWKKKIRKDSDWKKKHQSESDCFH